MKKNIIFLAGHKGMVGSSILRLISKEKFKYEVLTIDKKKLNLLDQNRVYNFLKKKKPKYIIIAAAKVGGIYANDNFKSKFLFENTQIQNNLIHGSYLSGIKNLIFLGSSCIYPKNINRPIKENDILTGSLEETNDAYAIAKISGMKLCEYYSKEYGLNYKSLMPTNLYGPNDNYDVKTSHFIPALIRKIYIAKREKRRTITLWGSGKPLREVMHVDDLASACMFFLTKKIDEPFINIGSGYEKSVKNFAKIICDFFDVKLKINYDKKKPDGMKRKRLNLKLARKYGWRSKINFDEGLKSTVESFLKKNYKI